MPSSFSETFEKRPLLSNFYACWSAAEIPLSGPCGMLAQWNSALRTSFGGFHRAGLFLWSQTHPASAGLEILNSNFQN